MWYVLCVCIDEEKYFLFKTGKSKSYWATRYIYLLLQLSLVLWVTPIFFSRKVMKTLKVYLSISCRSAYKLFKKYFVVLWNWIHDHHTSGNLNEAARVITIYYISDKHPKSKALTWFHVPNQFLKYYVYWNFYIRRIFNWRSTWTCVSMYLEVSLSPKSLAWTSS